MKKGSHGLQTGAVALILFVLGFGAALHHSLAGKSTPGNPHGGGKHSASFPVPKKTTGCKFQAGGVLPDPDCSPGLTRDVTVKEICKSGYTAKVRNVPQSLKNKVYAAYGIKNHQPKEYEIDHIVSLELGGDNGTDTSNLFPEKYDMRDGAHDKDKVENSLHRGVCKGKISLKDAQELIASDWRKAKDKKY